MECYDGHHPTLGETSMFNKYIWSLYRASATGQRVIHQAFPRFARFSGNAGLTDWRYQLNVSIPMLLSNPDTSDSASISTETISLRHLMRMWFEDHPNLSDGFKALLDQDGLYYEWDNENELGQIYWVGFGGTQFPLDVIGNIGAITTVMHRIQPEAYFPYYFGGRFNLLLDICRHFGISLPEVPGKLMKQQRALFYLEINRAIQEFRTQNNLTPSELNAFLYDFAPACLDDEGDDELPAPQRVWFLMAGIGTKADFSFLDTADCQTQSLWRGHRDARRGDVAILWCASPRAYLHSIWRITSDGYDDPLSLWYSLVRIGRPIIVPHLKIKDLKANPVLCQSPMVRAHFQGCAGKYFRPADYLALLEELAKRGMNIEVLPKMPAPIISFLDDGEDILNERTVETKLIEPLLDNLGLLPERDWKRQIRIRMGRGEKVYPDYVLGFKDTLDQEQAQIIIEAKYRIATHKALLEAFRQGRSYALRLGAQKLVLAALEGIWLIENKESFSLDKAQHWSWLTLSNNESRHEFSRQLDYQRTK